MLQESKGRKGFCKEVVLLVVFVVVFASVLVFFSSNCYCFVLWFGGCAVWLVFVFCFLFIFGFVFVFCLKSSTLRMTSKGYAKSKHI